MPESEHVAFSIETRLAYWKVCVSGPIERYPVSNLFTSTAWQGMWEDAVGRLVPTAFEDIEGKFWQVKLYTDIVQSQGLQGAQVLTMSTAEMPLETLERTRGLVRQVAKLGEEPLFMWHGFHRLSTFPDPEAELFVSNLSPHIVREITLHQPGYYYGGH